MAKSREQKVAEAATVSDADLAYVAALVAKHGLPDNSKTAKALEIVQAFLMFAGFGRNSFTAKILRVLADLIESDEIERAEEIEARVDGKRH